MSWIPNSPPRSITSSMICGSAYESMMWPRSSTISEKVIPPSSLSTMDAVILDVGGVLLVPHADAGNPALEPFGIQLSLAQAERAHYGGVRSLDAADDDAARDGSAYLVGYLAAVGLPAEDREQALARLHEAFS